MRRLVKAADMPRSTALLRTGTEEDLEVAVATVVLVEVARTTGIVNAACREVNGTTTTTRNEVSTGDRQNHHGDVLTVDQVTAVTHRHRLWLRRDLRNGAGTRTRLFPQITALIFEID